jgi:predicted lipoprotein with Yx(FWY)xxD motif
MTWRRRLLFALPALAAIVVVVIVVVLETTPTRSVATATTRPPSATVQAARSSLGEILVDRTGHTLYLFADDKPDRSVCVGACARVWPPATVSGKITVGHGVVASLLTTYARSGGARQLVYNGHPLYTSSADTQPGNMNGEGFFGEWFVVSVSGKSVLRPGEKASHGGGYGS